MRSAPWVTRNGIPRDFKLRSLPCSRAGVSVLKAFNIAYICQFDHIIVVAGCLYCPYDVTVERFNIFEVMQLALLSQTRFSGCCRVEARTLNCQAYALCRGFRGLRVHCLSYSRLNPANWGGGVA